MRANAASEHGIAIDVKVVRCDRGRDRRRTTGYKFRRFDRRYMLKYDLEVGQFAHERREDAIDKNRLAVEDIDRRIGHLAVGAAQKAVALRETDMALQREGRVRDGNAGVGVEIDRKSTR